jgi:Tfp pilus assembly protein PilV
MNRAWLVIEYFSCMILKLKTQGKKKIGKRKSEIFNEAGFLLIEVIISVSVFVLIVLAYSGTLMYGQENINLAGTRSRAIFLADEGMEIVKNIRDSSFNNLIDGTYGLSISGSNWIFLGTSDITDIFTREIQISTVDANTKQITSNITWQQNLQRQGSVSLVSYLTNWQDTVVVGTEANSLVVDTTNADVDSGDDTQVVGITLLNTGINDITINRMIISWVGGAHSSRLRNITIDTTNLWSGNASSGSDIDITDALLTVGSGVTQVDLLDFQRDMTGAVFDITFVMADNSTKQEIFTLGAGGGIPTGEAANLAVDTSLGALNPGDNTQITGITVENIGATDVTIDRVIVSWSGGANGNHFQGITIGGNLLWSGNRNSGIEIDIIDFLSISGSGVVPIDLIQMQKNTTGANLTISFIMSDSSVYTTSTINF